MLTKPATEKMIAEWKEIYAVYKDKIYANCKSVEQILDYINFKYTVSKLNMFEGNQFYCIERDNNSEWSNVKQVDTNYGMIR